MVSSESAESPCEVSGVALESASSSPELPLPGLCQQPPLELHLQVIALAGCRLCRGPQAQLPAGYDRVIRTIL